MVRNAILFVLLIAFVAYIAFTRSDRSEAQEPSNNIDAQKSKNVHVASKTKDQWDKQRQIKDKLTRLKKTIELQKEFVRAKRNNEDLVGKEDDDDMLWLEGLDPEENSNNDTNLENSNNDEGEYEFDDDEASREKEDVAAQYEPIAPNAEEEDISQESERNESNTIEEKWENTESRWAYEREDHFWTRNMRKELDGFFEKTNLENDQIVDVSCGTTLCRVEIDLDNPQNVFKLAANIGRPMAIYPGMSGSTNLIDAYFSRTGVGWAAFKN
ncbi:MAG: hypothetical protein GY847_21825 [Proteobacteria bacterium]|nr:hypothetical protein [Pseudomonadota bacterium]